MKTNPEKYNLLMNFNRSATMKIGEHTISNSYCEQQLGVKNQLNFNKHLETIIKKASQKIQLRLICVFQKESYY